MKAEPDASPEVVTFGCRLNMVESEVMRALAEQGLEKNLVIVNTCAVTAEATRQARQAIRRIARERPESRIVVTGCAAQIAPETFVAMPEVAHVLGNAEKTVATSWDHFASRENVAPIARARRGNAPAPLLSALEGHTRAFLAVQNGCDHCCTFCVIPQGRGPSRSVAEDEVLAQARRFVETGHKELVLTGVDLTSWGGDLVGAPRLGRLVRLLLRELPKLPRLRLSSIDCIEADDDLVAAFAHEERLTPYLHLSLQSGDDLILKRMKRRHSRAQAVDFCASLREKRPDMAFGADLIAGFPTEDEEAAARSRALVRECGLAFLHVFPFSARPETPAARMKPVAAATVKARAAALRAEGDLALERHLARQVGRRVQILAERGGMGRSADFTPAKTFGFPPGALFEADVLGVSAGSLDITADSS
ncbi:tRNA (N(6)-L-threonylcarbamoyladenosine(37)-C(2))-methylthiotransferase MtaB [Rhodoblastus sphagnicola]|uniref:tRNA (N(6)-L-threonylcarbamoyladenosine(37)-C(2))-methylthiotransferase MtaB n=1 Tax=Rhodoblastus sphagnicola TaxID=333368 RepID=A0A2S6MUC9_9HYPH|nr:tRNA (N(6)-L-threonylcarbamoyladenosine(37)-C(2))-methylthiotransferase MtaB [Rhodoblastus sphagnicola]MBB4197030.1 threonylcarbamoyladenosine tRNA methylthiotransferase MtaB [Rhodoblastus sphagnicola]PPQ25967.1 tRNA (N(6)-L-threonylcarbamoyladenosine(37)-C(2))-methylthiotransferase MtaB [Rhodoblastus sphagnicola]